MISRHFLRVAATVGRGSGVACGVSFLTLVACGSGGEESQCRVDADRSQTCGPSRVVLPIAENRGLVVEGTLDGRPVHLLVDTGAERTVVSSTLLGKPDESGALVNELCAGELCFRKEPVWAWDTPFSTDQADGINGFLGMNTLRELIVGIDHGGHVILDSRGTACAGRGSPLTFTEHETPLVKARVGSGAEATLALDTGSLFTVLGPETAGALTGEFANVAPTNLCTVNGCNDSSASTAVLASYCVFDRCTENVPIKFPVWDAVGFSYLLRFRIDLDFRAQSFVYCE